MAGSDVGDGSSDVEKLPEISGQSLVRIDVDLGRAVAQEHVQPVGVVGMEVRLCERYFCCKSFLMEAYYIDAKGGGG